MLSEATPISLKIYSAGDRIPWIREEVLEKRRMVRPPVQPEVEAGDIMIRDLRLWHAGMPNSSEKHRIMLGLGYMVSDHLFYIFKRCDDPLWMCITHSVSKYRRSPKENGTGLMMRGHVEPDSPQLQGAASLAPVPARVLHGHSQGSSGG